VIRWAMISICAQKIRTTLGGIFSCESHETGLMQAPTWRLHVPPYCRPNASMVNKRKKLLAWIMQTKGKGANQQPNPSSSWNPIQSTLQLGRNLMELLFCINAGIMLKCTTARTKYVSQTEGDRTCASLLHCHAIREEQVVINTL